MTLVLGGVALLVLVVLLWGMLRPQRAVPPAPVPVTDERQPCPLCGSRLKPGERVFSTVFASSTPDKIMEIAGCVHCKPPSELKRLCPVCKKELRSQDVVTARVFERKNETGAKKTHVHVLGCPRCRS